MFIFSKWEKTSLTVKNGKDRLTFKTTADRLQKASVSCKVFLNHYSVQTLCIRSIYTPDKEEWLPTVWRPGKQEAGEVRRSHTAEWRRATTAEGEALFSHFHSPHFSPAKSFSPPSQEHPDLPPLQCFEPWYDHSLDKHSSTMRGHKFFFLSSQTKLKKMPLVSGFWWELRVCFQFRVIPGTRRFLSKNRKVDGEEREGLGEEKKRRERRREGTLVNEHQMPYLRW